MHSQETEEQATPFDLIAVFQRCSNYPKDELGAIALAQGLVRAAQQTQVAMLAIVERCAELSQYCPTDADMLTVAREIREGIRRYEESQRNQIREWEREYGTPKPFKLEAKRTGSRRDDELWAKLRKKFPPTEAGEERWPDWRTLAAAARELGYEDYARAWEML